MSRSNPLADAFARLCRGVVRLLPFGLSGVVAPTFVGFALIAGVTFGFDLVLLTILHKVLGVAIGYAVTLGYVAAFGLAFLLNRILNFRSHAPVGGQSVLYAIAVGINYVAFILGVGAGLTTLGVHFMIARFLAGCCEGAFMYSVMRWVIFRERPASVQEVEVEPAREA